MNVSIYNVMDESLPRYLGQLLSKALAKGSAAIIKCRDEQEMEQLDSSLWTFESLGFVPHCPIDYKAKGYNAADFPIYMCTDYDACMDLSDDTHTRNLLVVTSGGAMPKDSWPLMNNIDTIVDIFNNQDIASGDSSHEQIVMSRQKEYPLEVQKLPVKYWYKQLNNNWQNIDF